MDGVVDGSAEVSEVPLRALWRKARGGGGGLRQASAGEEKKLGELVVVTGKQSREAKAAGHAAACLYTIYKDYLYLDL